MKGAVACFVNLPGLDPFLGSVADSPADLLRGVWSVFKVLSFRSWVDQCLISSGCLKSLLGFF